MEPRQGGFTQKGKEMIAEMNKLGMIVDVSHLSVKGFWELVDMSEKPFVASHSNVREVCSHPRNLSMDQIKVIIERQGRLGITFVPSFVKQQSVAQIHHLLHHIEAICSLGGEHVVGFGSDFDGIEHWIVGLEHAGHYDHLVNELCKRYSEDQVKRFLYVNWRNFLVKNLPNAK
ncbi:Membrane dipeptidase [compost metagenome]